ncbi:MAG TPA: CehA/McbA family metallohydrolase [Bryobacteraceae bacterium]
MRYLSVLLLSLSLRADNLPVIPVEHQPFAAQVSRLLEALDLLGSPFPAAEAAELRASNSVERMQAILDRRVLVGVEINPESRVKATEGPVAAELEQQGWRTFLIKVNNQAGSTPVLSVYSPNAGMLANSPEGAIRGRFLGIEVFNKQPLRPHLSGLALEYRIVSLFSRDAGPREARLIFDVGQGSQDLGFRSNVDLLFHCKPATQVKLRVKDFDGKPATASFLIKDSQGRVYPSQAKRLAPDFFFQPQVYRADGETVTLPPGDYTVEYTRGPEYRKKTENLHVGEEAMTLDFHLDRWIDPAAKGWYSGDHHVHAAGCAHYEKPSEGVYPQDMMRHIMGEDLKRGAVLTWGPGWYFQKTFFEGADNKLSTADNLMRYDVEVSGFPSSHTGHIVLLGLHDQDYPDTRRIEDWPSWGVPIFRWARKQGAMAGYAHSGWGLALKKEALPSYEMPPFDGIGANEYIVSVTQGLPDFISTVDTPYAWELNIWYHTLNAGYRTRISGETDFPCIYDAKVGLGRSYVRQKSADATYEDWIHGIREGRAYVSDGRSHLMDFKVNGMQMGEGDSNVAMGPGGRIHVTANVAALLDEKPDASVRGLHYDEKPYWNIERTRIGDSRRVPVELVVNGQAVAKKEIEADGKVQEIAFDYPVKKSSWVALRVLESSHTNPIWVTVSGKPVRASKESLEWCIRAVDQCWQQKQAQIRLNERGEAQRTYQAAKAEYEKRLAEVE